MKKKIIATILLVCLCICFLSAFSDVKPEAWYYEDVMEAYSLGIVEGNGNDTFSPEDPLKKEEMASLLYRILKKTNNLKSEKDYSGEYSQMLKRMGISDWALRDVAYGLKYGIWNENDFSGKDIYIDRRMISKWICAALSLPKSSLMQLDYGDLSLFNSSEYHNIFSLKKYGYMIGDEQKLFHPNDHLQRCEIASVCVRMKNSTIKVGDKIGFDLISYSGTASNFDMSDYSFIITSKNGISIPVQASKDAAIFLDGVPISFGALKLFANKKLYVSTLYGEDQTIIVQTKPTVLSGKIEEFEKRTDYTLVRVNLGTAIAPYYISKNTLGNTSLKKGDNIRFIADGCELLEVSK